MKAGLIGEKLTHSLSPDIHNKFFKLTGTPGDYSLFETQRDSLGELISRLEDEGYSGLNVTIPYKTEIMKYLDSLSEEATAIGAVNTVIFKNGKRFGANTDYYGLKELIESAVIEIKGSTVILGTGGAARCAHKLLSDLGAGEVITASRNPETADAVFSAVSYRELEALTSIGLLINTTPLGMYPDSSGCPLDESVIEKCGAVIDVIYNPPKTKLIELAQKYGIKAVNGLKMLCVQAVKSEEMWNGRIYGRQVYTGIYSYMRRKSEKANIIITGMPGSGKTTVGRELSKRLGMNFADTDLMIESKYGKISEIFRTEGEAGFRKYERESVEIVSRMRDTVISTGGGAVLDSRNINSFKETGVIVYLDRPLKMLLETDITGRPLLSEGKAAIEMLYAERRPIYEGCADLAPDNSGTDEECVNTIIGTLGD